MAINRFYWFVVIIGIGIADCTVDSHATSNDDNDHEHESSLYKYLEQGNRKQNIHFNNTNALDNVVLLSIGSINLLPIALVFLLIPTKILQQHPSTLTIFLSFASGGLAADVFLRLLPHIILSYDTSMRSSTQFHLSHQHENGTGLFILTGIFMSLIVEKIFRYSQTTNTQSCQRISVVQSKRVLGYLFLLADTLHNYANSISLYTLVLMESTINSTTMLTKVIYEVLHIIYGYAILIFSGWTSEQALQYQLTTALNAALICLGSLQVQSHLVIQLWSTQIFLPVIAGIFVYMSTVHLIPEVIENSCGTKETFLKVTAFIISVLSIFCLKKYE